MYFIYLDDECWLNPDAWFNERDNASRLVIDDQSLGTLPDTLPLCIGQPGADFGDCHKEVSLLVIDANQERTCNVVINARRELVCSNCSK